MGTSTRERQARHRSKLKDENRHQILATLSAEHLELLDGLCEHLRLKRDAVLAQAVELLAAKIGSVQHDSGNTAKLLRGRELVLCPDGVFRSR